MFRRIAPLVIVMLVGILIGSIFQPLQTLSVTAQGCRSFPETGKQVCGRFLEYWQANGGLAQQGLPLTGEFSECSDLNGQTYTVQYFERAVFEKHPENRRPHDVLLSQLGTFQFKRKYPAGDPSSGSVPPPTPIPGGPKTAGDIVDLLKKAGMPIGAVKIYNAEDDPNKLLGRPGYYTSKASFHDPRLAEPEDPSIEIDVESGGGIEVFTTQRDATARRGYLESFNQNPLFGPEYLTQRGTVLLRMSGDLTPTQAEEYKRAFLELALP